MRTKRRFILIAMLLGVLAGLAFWFLRPSPEPVYNGKTLTQWLDACNDAGKMENLGPFSEAIRAMGTNSLPILLHYIRHQDSALHMALIRLLKKQHLIKPITSTEWLRIDPAILALHELGSNALPALPELRRMADDPDAYQAGVWGMLAIGTNSIPTLESVCQSTILLARISAARTIASLTAEAPPYFACNWRRDQIHQRNVLGFSNPLRDEDLLVVIGLLKHPSAAVRRSAAEALGLYKLNSAYSNVLKSAVGPLTKASNDPDPAVRKAAADCLKGL